MDLQSLPFLKRISLCKVFFDNRCVNVNLDWVKFACKGHEQGVFLFEVGVVVEANSKLWQRPCRGFEY